MKISIDIPSNLLTSEIKNINTVAALGFGQDETEEMLADTMRHVENADIVQRSYIDGGLVGFALYKRLLWQSCY